MKLIIKDSRIVATADDSYTGPDFCINAPADFDPSRLSHYRYIDDNLVIPPPDQVDMAQAKLALLYAGLLDDIDAAINGMSREAQIEWEYRTTVRRDSALVGEVKNLLGWTDQQLDDLFILASGL